MRRRINNFIHKIRFSWYRRLLAAEMRDYAKSVYDMHYLTLSIPTFIKADPKEVFCISANELFGEKIFDD